MGKIFHEGETKRNRRSYTFIGQNRLYAKIVTRDQIGHYTMIKGSIYQEDIHKKISEIVSYLDLGNGYMSVTHVKIHQVIH